MVLVVTMLIPHLFPPLTELEFLELAVEFMYYSQFILQLSKIRFSVVKQLSQGHTSGKQSYLP